MTCNECDGKCGYKEENPCEHCIHNDEPLFGGICESCANSRCEFKKNDAF